uniref:Uncharacterized protein n=1 Tax=Arundo donax TaxID=35708 RepID=A0A0A9GR86_ARUDO
MRAKTERFSKTCTPTISSSQCFFEEYCQC